MSDDDTRSEIHTLELIDMIVRGWLAAYLNLHGNDSTAQELRIWLEANTAWIEMRRETL